MKKSVLAVAWIGWVLNGCAANVAGTPAGGQTQVDPDAVSADGLVVASSSAPLDDVYVWRFPNGTAIETDVSTHAANNGSFTLAGLEGNTREWLVFEQAAFTRVLLPVETTKDAHQSLGTTTVLSDAETAQWVKSLGGRQDPAKSILQVMVVGAADANGASVPLSDFEVTLNPKSDLPVYRVGDQAIVLNVPAYPYQSVTVTSQGRTCRPVTHPEIAQYDGSVGFVTLAGSWTIAPLMRCE